jgi:hypothetical protein
MGWPISFQPIFIDLDVPLLTPPGLVLNEGRLVDDGCGLLTLNDLAGGWLEQILFFHIFL